MCGAVVVVWCAGLLVGLGAVCRWLGVCMVLFVTFSELLWALAVLSGAAARGFWGAARGFWGPVRSFWGAARSFRGRCTEFLGRCTEFLGAALGFRGAAQGFWGAARRISGG